MSWLWWVLRYKFCAKLSAIFGIVLLLLFPATGFSDEVKRRIEVKLHQHTLAEYQDYIKDFDPLSDAPVKAEGLNRHLAETVLFTIAPQIGGCECEIVIEPYKTPTNFTRIMREVSAGRQPSSPIAAFGALLERTHPNLLPSDPVLREDEFYVGLYTHEDRDEILSLTDPQDILALNFTVAETWDIDAEVISVRGLKLTKVVDWDSIINSIAAGRTDIVLQPFSGEPDMSFIDSSSGNRMVPIPGFKMKFPHSRRYFVSPTHPDGGEEFLESLNRGLNILRENGKLHDYLYKAGVLDERIENFEEL